MSEVVNKAKLAKAELTVSQKDFNKSLYYLIQLVTR